MKKDRITALIEEIDKMPTPFWDESLPFVLRALDDPERWADYDKWLQEQKAKEAET